MGYPYPSFCLCAFLGPYYRAREYTAYNDLIWGPYNLVIRILLFRVLYYGLGFRVSTHRLLKIFPRKGTTMEPVGIGREVRFRALD